MKVELKSINISAFQNIAENQEIIFRGPGIYSLVGYNEDDGGNNGSGKTAFTRAITAGILGTKHIDINNKEIKSRVLNTSPKIIIDLLLNDVNVRINRVIGGKLDIIIDQTLLEGKSDEIQSKFIDRLGATPDQFLSLTHKLQGSSSSFLLMSDSEKKDFLGAFFDTRKIDAAKQTNSLQIKALNTEMLNTSNSLSVLSGQMQALKMAADELLSKVQHVTSDSYNKTLFDKKTELANITKTLQDIQAIDLNHMIESNEQYHQLIGNLSDIDAALKDAESDYQVTLPSINNQISDINRTLMIPPTVPADLELAVSNIKTQISQSHNAKQLIAQAESDIKKINSDIQLSDIKLHSMEPGKCQLCKQPISDSSFQEMQEKIKKSISESQYLVTIKSDQIKELQTSLQDLNVLNIQLEDALSEIAKIKTTNNTDSLKQMLANLKGSLQIKADKIANLKKQKTNCTDSIDIFKKTTTANYNNWLNTTNMQYKQILRDVENMETEYRTAIDSLAKSQNKYEDCRMSLQTTERKLSELTYKIKVHQKIDDILSPDGFLGYIFDTVLEEINQEINSNIKQLPVTSRFSVYFSPDKMAKTTGNVTKSIVYKIFDKDEEVSLGTLSGAEQQGLIVVTEAAVDSVLSSRLGFSVNYKIFDEQFGFVDQNNKESILEFIKQKYYDKIVLMIDHGSELNAAIDQKIIIRKQNGLATVGYED